MISGEVAPPALIEFLRGHLRQHPAFRVINHYGPTETTVGVLSNELAELQTAGDSAEASRNVAHPEVSLLTRPGSARCR